MVRPFRSVVVEVSEIVLENFVRVEVLGRAVQISVTLRLDLRLEFWRQSRYSDGRCLFVFVASEELHIYCAILDTLTQRFGILCQSILWNLSGM